MVLLMELLEWPPKDSLLATDHRAWPLDRSLLARQRFRFPKMVTFQTRQRRKPNRP